MTAEVAVIIAACGFLLNLIVSVGGWKRGVKQNSTSETAQITTIIVKLENIGDGISEIKSDMKNIRIEVQELRERVAKVESSCASFHHRLDSTERNMKHEN